MVPLLILDGAKTFSINLRMKSPSNFKLRLKAAKRRFEVMIKMTDPVLGNRLRQDEFFEFERLYRKEVVAHNPGQRKVMTRRDHVVKAKDGFTAACQPDGLHRLGMAANLFYMEAFDYLIPVGHQLKLARFHHRSPIVGQIACTVAFVRVLGSGEFAF